MPLHTYLERMKYIDDLIRKRATGNLASLAKKLKLSKTQTVNFLKEMKEYGFPIEYSRKLNSYFYNEKEKIVPAFFLKNNREGNKQEDVMTRAELRKISGGKNFQLFCSYQL